MMGNVNSSLKDYIESIMPGMWINEDKLDECKVTHVAYTFNELKPSGNIFISMTEQTFLEGSKNTGVYGSWKDTHSIAKNYLQKISLLIVEKEIQSTDIPQYQVENSYEFLLALSKRNRPNYQGKIVSVTGTVGKTMTCELLKLALNDKTTTLAANGNFNSRTAIRAMLASLLPETKYDYAILETAVASLWFGEAGVAPETQSDYAILTQFGRGQKETTVKDTIRFKTNITKKMSPDAKVILNQDVEEYDDALAAIKENTSSVFTYSQENREAYTTVESLDFKEQFATINVRVNKRLFSFQLRRIDGMDKGFVSNLLAVVTFLYLEGFELEEYFSVFLHFKSRAHLLEERSFKLSEKKITLIDDTYNAEELSIKNAIGFVDNAADKYCGKKMAIIGKVISIGKLREEVYQNIAQRFAKSRFDLVVTFDDEVEILQNYLPKNMRGGHFTDLKLLRDKLTDFVTEDSLILLKGSTRSTRIRTIIPLLEGGTIVANSTSAYGCIDSEGIRYFSNKKITAPFGVSNILIVHEILYRVSENLLQLDDLVIFKKNMLELNSIRSTKAYESEKRYLRDVLSQAVSLNAPDAILALSGHLFKDNQQALRSLKAKAEFYGINPKSVLNVTGRSNRENTQKVALEDIAKAAQLFMEIPKEYLSLLVNRNWIIRENSFVAGNPYDKRLKNTATFLWGVKKELGILIHFAKDKPVIAVGINDQGLSGHIQMLEYLAAFNEEPNFDSKEIVLDSPKVNILGDVYFGEWYTEKRKKQGRNDALQEYGYDYSFKELAKMFPKEEFNIVNFEGVFPKYPKKQSPLAATKPFVLGGEATESIRELKNRNIDLVTLATNHLFDYGQESIGHTIDQFEERAIITLGAGKNQKEAHKIVELQYKDKKIALFNAYWYREMNDKSFNPHAIGKQTGVAAHTEAMKQGIRNYKMKNPASKILLISHWGVDFNPIHSLQEKIASEFIEAGVDLIIGHGPHFIQPVRVHSGKKVIYSIGNGVFNSNGEFDERKIPPYGLFTQLDLAKEEVRLYPIYIHNKKTFWQPHFIEEKQISEFKMLDLGELNRQNLSKDSSGNYYLNLTI